MLRNIHGLNKCWVDASALSVILDIKNALFPNDPQKDYQIMDALHKAAEYSYSPGRFQDCVPMSLNLYGGQMLMNFI
jgi:hypothetical protein